ncbi:MAG TPA: lytic murein transglycosylase [Pseudolabrys sp.]|nr:lytic murein transglycosylase [Pseudolabrys sp.]
MIHRRTLLGAFSALLVTPLRASGQAPLGNETGTFAQFVAALWPDAQAKGITRATFDLAMKGVTPDARVATVIKRQPEYGKPIGAYVNGLVTKDNIAIGIRKEAEWRATFDAVEKKFGVERWILIAIWGMETSYGAAKDRWDVFRSLATLAYIQYRPPYFRNELIVAMRLMQENHFPREKMVSSWAGAMGQTQFMPTNVIDYAVDFDGDGKRDIWNDVPDVMGSTGNYLQHTHWKPGVPWGFEVTVPKGFDYKKSRGSYPEWTAVGVHRADGKAFPSSGNGILFFPSGAVGPAFIATENFDVLKEYNNSDAYVLAVGHLADRMHGGAPIRAAWPANDRQLSRDQRIALQRRLSELGYKINDFEGHVDFDLRDNIRDEQVKYGMVADGNPTEALLARIGIK